MVHSLIGAEGGWQEFSLQGGEWTVLLLSVLTALLALVVGVYLARLVLAADQGTPKMRRSPRRSRRARRPTCDASSARSG